MSVPPAYTSQPPMIPSLQPNASEHSLSSSLPPYSSQLPPNHVVIPPAQVAAMVQTNRPPQRQPAQPIQPQPQPQVVQQVTPQAITPQTVIPQSIQPQPQPQFVQPLPYSTPYYLINDIPSGPVLLTGPVYGPIPYPYSVYPSPYLSDPSQIVSPYAPTYLSYQPQVPIQPHVQLQIQQPMITHQGMPFQEHGYPGPGSLPPGGRWALTNENGKRTLWTIMPGETRPSGWAYPGDAR